MRAHAKKWLNHAAVPYLLLLGLALVYFLGVSVDYGDDGAFRAMVGDSSALRAALDYRQTWSSRFVSEVVLFQLYKWPGAVWQVLNSAVLVLLAYSLAKLAGGGRRMGWLACGAALVYPLSDMISAGWVTTTLNYLWPMAFALYAITPWVGRLAGQRVRWWSYVLSIPALVFAASAEQIFCIMAGFVVAAAAFMVKERLKPNAYQIIWVVVLAAMGVQIALAPGPKLRVAEEAARFNPEFSQTNPLVRMMDVFMDMSWYVIFNRGAALLLAAVVIFAAVAVRQAAFGKRLAAAVPLGLCLAFGPLYPAASVVFPSLAALKSNDYEYEFLASTMKYFPLVVYLLLWGSLLAALVLAARTRREALVLAVVFAAGFLSQLIMFMAPSATISFSRYTITMQVALLLAALLLLRGLAEDKATRPALQMGTATMAVLASGGLLNLYLAR